MAIEVKQGVTCITGEHIQVFQLLSLKAALGLEIVGMKRRGQSAYSVAKSMGFKGNKQKVYKQLCSYIDSLKPETTYSQQGESQ
jgi:hypothetical protein